MVSLAKKLTSKSRSHRVLLDLQAGRIQPRYAVGSDPYQDYPVPNFRIKNTKTLAIEISDLLSAHAERVHGNLRSRLEQTGSRLCDLVLGRDLLEVLRQEDSFSYLALEVHRSLAWIPWELIWDGDQFLCQRFCVARKLIRPANWRQPELPDRTLLPRALIALGDTSDLNPDPEAASIKKMLHDLAHLDVRKSEPLRADELKEQLKEGYDILHFIGHGAYVPGDPLHTGLRCSDQILTSTDLEQISVATKFPFLIFANACDSARPNLADAEVYASELYEGFVRRGTENYIGTLAQVPDDLSTEFAGSFYERLGRGASLGEALGYARRRSFDEENHEIWAYYVHYGDPESRLLPQTTPATWIPPLDGRVRGALRQEELGDLRTTLEENRVVAVVGEPKIGKTSLVALLARILEAEVGALILYYDLRLDNTTVILEQLLDRANIPVRGTFHENLSLLVTLLGERHCCVVLDNFESALDEENLCIADPRLSQLIDALLVARSRSRSFVVLTCRYPVRTQNYNTVPVFPLHGIAEQVALPYLVHEYGWVAEDAKRIYDIRAGNPLVLHVCSEAIQDRQRLGINFDDALRQVHTLGTKLTYGEYYESFTDVERFIVDIIALHPVGISLDGIAYILRGEALENRDDDLFSGITDVVPPGFPYADISDIVVHLYRRGALAMSDGMMRLLPQDRSYVYNLVKSRQKWWLLHRLAAEYYWSDLARFYRNYATEMKSRDSFTVCEYIFYHDLRGGVFYRARNVMVRIRCRLIESKNYETLRHYYEELLGSRGFDLQSAYDKGCSYRDYAICLFDLGRLEEGRRYLSKAERSVEQEKESRSRDLRAHALLILGLLARKLGDPPEQEIKLYERAMESQPDRNDRKFFDELEVYLADARKRLNACSANGS